MLKLADYRSKAKGLPDLLPYAALIAPGVILNKDGSFLAAWEVRGQDTASSTPEELAYVSAQFNNAVRLLGTGWMLHFDAIRAGHNVLCEKPMAATVRHVDRMIAAARQTGKVLAVFQQSRFSPAFRKIREVIASGKLGRVVQISMNYNGFSRRCCASRPRTRWPWGVC